MPKALTIILNLLLSITQIVFTPLHNFYSFLIKQSLSWVILKIVYIYCLFSDFYYEFRRFIQHNVLGWKGNMYQNI